MNDFYEPARFEARVKAGLLDFGAAILLWILLAAIDLPLLGILICSVYLLLRDSLDGQSFGKKWQGLHAINLDTQRPCNWLDSIMRNLFVFLPLVGPPWALVELYYASKDEDFQRLGDRFANTLVIEGATVPETESSSSNAEVLPETSQTKGEQL